MFGIQWHIEQYIFIFVITFTIIQTQTKLGFNQLQSPYHADIANHMIYGFVQEWRILPDPGSIRIPSKFHQQKRGYQWSSSTEIPGFIADLDGSSQPC